MQEINRSDKNEQRAWERKEMGLMRVYTWNNLLNDPSTGVNNSNAADRWESEIGLKTAASQIDATDSSKTRNLRFLAIPVKIEITNWEIFPLLTKIVEKNPKPLWFKGRSYENSLRTAQCKNTLLKSCESTYASVSDCTEEEAREGEKTI